MKVVAVWTDWILTIVCGVAIGLGCAPMIYGQYAYVGGHDSSMGARVFLLFYAFVSLLTWCVLVAMPHILGWRKVRQ